MKHVTVPVATAYCPVAQPMQHVETDAPVVVRYWPEAHDVHAVKPVVAVCLPAAQSGQAARPRPSPPIPPTMHGPAEAMAPL